MPKLATQLMTPMAEEISPPFVNPLEKLLGYQIRRASLAMLADLATSIADLDLRVTETSILLVIDANPDITQSDIGRILSVQRANMVPLTAVLNRRKLIRRAGTNGRSHALRLTVAGKAIADECRRRIDEHEARFLGSLPATERTALLQCLRNIWMPDP